MMMLLPPLLPDPYTHRPTMYLSCSQAQLPEQERDALCLHELTINMLMGWREQKCQTLVATRGDCMTCAKSPYANPLQSRPDEVAKEKLEDKLFIINAKLAERNISGMVVHWLDEPSWQAQKQGAIMLSQAKNAGVPHEPTNPDRTTEIVNPTGQSSPVMLRRGFLSRLINPAGMLPEDSI